MAKYKRTSLNLEDLSPKSASKVFTFIDELFDNSFDLKQFEKDIYGYDIGEKYFIYYYLRRYLSYDPDSYINRSNDPRIEHFREQEEVINNIDRIKSFIDNEFKTVERRFKKAKGHNKYIHPLVMDHILNHRIPLFFPINSIELKKFIEVEHTLINVNNFKAKIKEILKDDIPSKDFEKFFYNSFSFPNNTTDVESLFIEIDNSRRLYKNMYKVYNYYNEVLRKEYDILNQRFNRAIENKKPIVEKLDGKSNNKLTSISTKDFKRLIILGRRIKPKKLRRIDVMIIMYNAFPQIRESAKSYLNKNPNKTKGKAKSRIEIYLETKGKNLKN